MKGNKKGGLIGIMRNFSKRKNLKSPETINIHAPTYVGDK